MTDSGGGRHIVIAGWQILKHEDAMHIQARSDKAIPIMIVAGGDGSRMGAPKPLQMVGGCTLLSRALGFAHRHSDNVAIAVRDAAQAGDGITDRMFIDPLPGEGPVNGLLSAFAFAGECGSDMVMLIGCDMPMLPENLLARFARSLNDRGAVIGRSAGKLHPAAGLWRVRNAELDIYTGSGRRSLTGFAEMVAYGVVDWDTETHDPFFNVNRPEDLAKAEMMVRAIDGDECSGLARPDQKT